MGRTTRLRLGGFAVLGLLLVLWEVASRAALVNQVYVPPVSQIGGELWRLLLNGELARHLGASAVRFGLGYGLAVAVGLGIGLVMGYFRAGYLLLEPLIELLRPLPPPAIIPIAILFLGIWPHRLLVEKSFS